MGLRSFLLETENAPRRCLVLIIIILCLTGYAIWDGGGPNLKPDGPMVTVEGKAVLKQCFDKDTIATTINDGDSVRVLAINLSSFGQRWLVKTQTGDIGWIDASDFKGIRQIVTDGPDKGDTVSIKPIWLGNYIHEYSYTAKDGEETKRSTEDFIPDLEGWKDLQYNDIARAGISTQAKFTKETDGKSFEELNEKFATPVLVHFTSDGFMAQYSWKAYDPSSGEMYTPNVTFGKDSIATAVDFVKPTSRGASWMKHMPLVTKIIDLPFTSFYIHGARYNMEPSPLLGGWGKFLVICMLVIIVIVYFCWMFAMQTVPVLLMGWLMKFPLVFKPLSDQVLKLLLLVVMLVCVYIHAVIMLAWGMFPFWTILIFIAGWYAFSLAQSPLCTYPHIRCPHCRHLYTIKFDHEDFEYSEIKKGSDIVRGKLLGSYRNTWQRWTDVTTRTTYGDGHTTTSTHRENIQNMAQDIEIYQYIDYEVTYRLDHYRDYHICSKCGLVEETTPVSYTELDRKIMGYHSGKEIGEEYRT